MKIYISNYLSGSISIIDTVSIGGSLSQIIINNDELFLANEDTNSIYILDKEGLNPVGVISVDNMIL